MTIGARGPRTATAAVDGRYRVSSQIFNPPGRSELDYRVGSYRSFLRAMVERLRSSRGRRRNGPEEVLARPFPRGLAHSESDNWILSLMKSWATIGDVLAFYQERIANEGFVRTAVEERSLREMARMVDYVSNPTVAARGSVAFQVAKTKGLVERILVPKGTKIMSLPIRSRLPEHFETLSDLEARREWNAICPRIPSETLEPALSTRDRGLELRGARTGLKVGDAVVISGRWRSTTSEGPGRARLFRLLSEVVPIRTEPVRMEIPGVSVPAATGSAGPSASAGAASAAPPSSTGKPPSDSKGATARRLPASKQRTRVGWLRPLRSPGPEEPEDVLREIEVTSLRRRAVLFGHNAPKWKDLPAKTKRQYQPILGGVQLSEDAGDHWQSLNVDLPEKPLRAIVAGADGSLFVAVSGAGIYRRPAQGSGWKPVNQGLSKKDVHVLTVEASGFLLAGATDGAVFRSVDSGESWQAISGSILKKSGDGWKAIDTRLPRVTVRSLQKVDEEWGSYLFAGTDQGVYRSSDESSGWEPVNQGLPGTSADSGASKLVVQSVVSGDQPGLLILGSKSGVFVSRDLGGWWTPASRGLPGTDNKGLSKTEVFELQAYSDERGGRFYLVAATSHGVYRSLDRGRSWRPANHGLPETDPATGASKTKVRSLARSWDAQALTTDLFAATSAGLYRSNDQGGTWERIAEGSVGVDVVALGSAGKDRLIAAGPMGGFSSDHWPDFRLQKGRVDISGVQPKVLPGGWIAIVQERENKEPLEGIYRVESVDTTVREDFTLKETVTRVQVDAGNELGVFDLRQAKVYLHGEPREIYLEERVRREPLPVKKLTLDVLLEPAPEPHRTIIVSGKRMRSRIHVETKLTGKQRQTAATIAAGQECIVDAHSEAGTDSANLSLRQPGSGATGSVAVSRDRFTWMPAVEEDPEVAELSALAGTEVVEFAGSRPVTRLILESPLTHCFDPETVTVYANVAIAVAGESVPEDVMGSGSSAKAHQGFVLQKPLTYDADTGGSGIASTLKVFVDNVEWTEVATFFDSGPRDEAFVVRQDALGRPHVLFGDGTRGARLPTGHDNVVATYRSGNSTAGVEAGHLKMLRTRPVGLQSVSNPIPIGPGIPAEGSEGIRRRLPLSVRALGRAVSFDDYADVALTYPGIAKARVAQFWTGSSHLIHITTASDKAAAGGSVAGERNLSDELQRYLHSNRLGEVSLAVVPATVRTFSFGARLLIDRRQQAEIVERRARERLAESFSALAGDFEMPITPADLVAALQVVDGVEVVEPLSLFWSGAAEQLAKALTPAPPIARQGIVSPAELAALDNETVVLEIAGAP